MDNSYVSLKGSLILMWFLRIMVFVASTTMIYVSESVRFDYVAGGVLPYFSQAALGFLACIVCYMEYVYIKFYSRRRWKDWGKLLITGSVAMSMIMMFGAFSCISVNAVDEKEYDMCVLEVGMSGVVTVINCLSALMVWRFYRAAMNVTN